MIKKNLIILLLIPFLIAILGAVAINTTYKIIENDILAINWNYKDTEAFKLSDELYELKASYVSEKSYEPSPGNELIWTVENKFKNDTESHCSIVERNGFYLKTLSVGEVIITCANKKGNVFRNMTAIIYETGAIIINPEISSSQTNIDNSIYYGEYDYHNNEKQHAQFNLEVSVVPEEMKDYIYIDKKSDNIDFDLENGKVSILSSGKAFIEIGCGASESIKNQSFNFEIVKDGVNVYSYDELLNCTNKSSDGEIVVLRKSFESLENYNNSSANNVELFGNYKNKSFNFKNDIYKFETTYNHEYIDQWNENVSKNKGKTLISKDILVGLRIQKDFYGNGYTINLHNLTFPSGVSSINGIEIPTLMPKDLFRGPLPFYTLGDHNNMPLIEAYGQDNIGMYIDGENITVNDINIKNCDFGNSLRNLDTVGTVVEISGKNNTLINSRVSNGKNVVRAFQTDNATIKNSLLSNARNFLLYVGSNDFIKPDNNKEYEFNTLDGTKQKTTNNSFFENNGVADEILTSFATGSFDNSIMMYKSLSSMQNALNDTSKLYDNNGNVIYKGSVNVDNTFFYRSGVSSIGLDSMFNGAFLYSAIPSVLSNLLGLLQTQDGIKLSDVLPTNIGGMSYPVVVNISDDTRFYDYKEIDDVDISGLINENIMSFAQSASEIFNVKLPDGFEITIDKFFPIKDYLLEGAIANNAIYEDNDKTYINCPIAYYGGGANLTKVNIESNINSNLSDTIKIDLANKYVLLQSDGSLSTSSLVKSLMQKAVTVTCGFEPFKFVCVKNNGYLYGETPNIKDLKKD